MSVDMSNFITPKSDQLNADDLLAGPRTIKVTGVRANESSAEQPISISFDADNGKPYKPCKSMRRVMVHVWGANASAYIGRSMTVYCDPDVQFGGMKVGGIRISHMSHIDEPRTMALTATRARRANFTVQPLRAATATATLSYPTVADYEACTDAATLERLKARSRETWKQTPTDVAPKIKAASNAATERIKNASAPPPAEISDDPPPPEADAAGFDEIVISDKPVDSSFLAGYDRAAQ
jgi:hypothetical protein